MEPRLPERAPTLTDRQREVAYLVAAGLTNAEIGDRLGISLDGAKYHVSEVLARLNLERREQITEWVHEQAPRRRVVRAGVLGLAAALVTAGIGAVLLLAGTWGDDATTGPPAAETAATTTAAVETAENSGESDPTPVAVDEGLAALYQPVAWDDPTRVNRTPPLSLDEAIKERPVHADGWQFEGEMPAVFDDTLSDSDVCPAPRGGVGRVQSGDWVIDVSATNVEGTDLPRGQRLLTLYPSAPDLLEDLDPFDGLVRIRAIDTANWRATHLTEALWKLEEMDDGSRAYRFLYESPRDTQWMAVVTAGPLWGCLTLEVENDQLDWPPPSGQFWQYPASPRDDKGDDQLLRDFSMVDGEPHGGGDRSCVNLTFTPMPARSGEFGMVGLTEFGNGVDSDYSPFARESEVTWIPQYKRGLGTFRMRATLVTSVALGWELGSPSQPIHTYSYIAEGPEAPVGSDFAFVTNPVLPRSGYWSMLATADPYNFGCFQMLGYPGPPTG